MFNSMMHLILFLVVTIQSNNILSIQSKVNQGALRFETVI